MPPLHFALMLCGVLLAAGLTVWLTAPVGPAVLIPSLPLFLIATLLIRKRRK